MIVRFLGYKKSTIYAIKKRFDAEVVENGGVVSGVGEPSPARKVHKRRNDAADVSDPDFVKKLQRRINKNPGRPIRRLAADLKVDESTIRRYLKEHIRYRRYKMRKGQFITEEPKARRFEKAKNLLNKLKNMGKKDRQGTTLIFL